MKKEFDENGYSLIPPMQLEEYAEAYKDFFMFKREDGILEICAHTNGGPVIWREAYHKAFGDIARWAGRDTENKVIIVTTYGDRFPGGVEPESVKYQLVEGLKDENLPRTLLDQFDQWYNGRAIMENWVWEIHVPTIAVMTGGSNPWFFQNFDVLLCADDLEILENHFQGGNLPGDGNWNRIEKSVGSARANYMAYTGKSITAKEAEKLGVISKALPREELMDYAWNMAREIIKQPAPIRQQTHELMRERAWKELCENFTTDIGLEWYAISLLMGSKQSKLHEAAAKISRGEPLV